MFSCIKDYNPNSQKTWIPACAGMTEADEEMTEVNKGITEVDAEMTKIDAGMT